MKRAPRSRQRHDLYAKYHDYDSEISDLLGECGIRAQPRLTVLHPSQLLTRTPAEQSRPANSIFARMHEARGGRKLFQKYEIGDVVGRSLTSP